jgi:hypothetical protein
VTFAWVVERFDLEHDRQHASDHLGTWRCAEGPGDFTQRVALPP